MGRGGGDQGNTGQQDQRRESKQNHEMKHTAWGWYSKLLMCVFNYKQLMTIFVVSIENTNVQPSFHT